MSDERHGVAWGSLIPGLILGLAAGLAYAWFVNPVNYVNIAPNQLKSEYKDQYVVLIGQAYLHDLDLARARQRLTSLGYNDPAGVVSQQADDAFARSASPDTIRALTILAEALGGHPQAADIFSGTAPAPSASQTPSATFQGVPTLTPTLTALPPSPTMPTPTQTPALVPTNATMKLVAEQTLCDATHPPGQMQVFVLDVNNAGIPGIKVLIQWQGGSDVFFTGLKPELGPGYGDFDMQPSLLYSVTLVGLAEPVEGISSAPCTTDKGVSQTPSYQLTFAPVTNP